MSARSVLLEDVMKRSHRVAGRKAYKCVLKAQRKRLDERYRHRWKDAIKINIRETIRESISYGPC